MNKFEALASTQLSTKKWLQEKKCLYQRLSTQLYRQVGEIKGGGISAIVNNTM